MASYHELIRHNGNEDLFRAIEMSLVALANGHAFHLHAEGLRGTGKTTIMRSVKSILPPIDRIKGCLYNCHPQKPHCPEHRHLSDKQIAQIGIEQIPCPFLEVSQGAKIGTVVGTIDLVKLTDKYSPEASLLPGTLAQAHRGIVFIDEINRLADTSPELADVLLDAMGTKPGRIQIEETGLPPVELPISVTVWAASNPDEDPGALAQVRRQLSDRFDLSVIMSRPNNYQAVHSILDGHVFDNITKKTELSFMATKGMLETISVSKDIRDTVACVYVDFNIESLRAVQALEMGAALESLRTNKTEVTVKELLTVAPLVLSHRTDSGTITGILKYLASLNKSVTISEDQQMILPGNKCCENNMVTEHSSAISQWWKTLKQKLTLGSNPMIKPDHQTASPQSSQSGTVPGKVQKQSKLVDALQNPVQAPPGAALPLARLPIEKYLTSDEEQHG